MVKINLIFRSGYSEIPIIITMIIKDNILKINNKFQWFKSIKSECLKINK